MELVHLLALLSDTAQALDDKHNSEWQQMKLKTNNDGDENCYRSISIMATIDKFTYSAMPTKVVGYIHHWVDVVETIDPVVEESGGYVMNKQRGDRVDEGVNNL